MVNPVSDALYLKKKFNKKNYPVSYETSRNSLHLPSSITLKKNEIDFICNEIITYWTRQKLIDTLYFTNLLTLVCYYVPTYLYYSSSWFDRLLVLRRGF